MCIGLYHVEFIGELLLFGLSGSGLCEFQCSFCPMFIFPAWPYHGDNEQD